MKLIKLTRPIDGEKVYCNVDNISNFYRNYCDRDRTIVQFVGGEDCYLNVLESPETIARLIELVTECENEN